MRSATGEALKEKGAALPSADGVHEASSSKTRTEEHRTGNGGGGAGSLMLLTRSPPLPLKRQTRRVVGGLAQEILLLLEHEILSLCGNWAHCCTSMEIDICAQPACRFIRGAR
jgi:hypothetical protein